MTENTMTALDTAAVESSSKRPLILAGGVAGALALGAAGYFLLLGGGSDTASTAPVASARQLAVRPVVAAPKAQPAAKTTIPQVSNARLGRDPFKALYVEPVAAPAPVAQAPAATTTTPTSTMPGTATAPGAAGTTTGTQSYTLSLLSVSTVPGGAHVYAFNVGGTKQSVLAAQRFGRYGELVVLAYATGSRGQVVGAIVQVGDDNPVEVPIGGKISVL
jgi:hypothetical protein